MIRIKLEKQNGAFTAALLGAAAGLVFAFVMKAALAEEFLPPASSPAQDEQNEISLALMEKEASLLAEKEALLFEISRTDARLAELEGVIASQSAKAEETLKELESTRVLSGQKDMSGPGVRVILDDAPRESFTLGEDPRFLIVHDIDVLRVVNRLRGAGAECVSINGERLVSNSRIRCGGPTIHVKDRTLAPPFEILAIGDPESLYQSLAAPSPDGGMSELEMLRFFGVQAWIEKAEELTVPRYIREFSFQYASSGQPDALMMEG